MEVFTVQYKSANQKEKAIEAIGNRCDEILHGMNDLENLRRLCGSIAYSSVFLIPSFDLVDGKQYSVEAICTQVRSMLAKDMRDFLMRLGVIATSHGSELLEALHAILYECTFPEVMEFLGLPFSRCYFALLSCYMRLVNYDTYPEVIAEFKAGDNSYGTLWNFFISTFP